VVKVTGSSDKRVSLAALMCIRPGQRPRLIYRVHHARQRSADRRKGFTEADYAQLLDAAHQQLAGPLVLVWDNLNTHVSGVMAELIAARDWLMVYQLPAYAHELNPVDAHLIHVLAPHRHDSCRASLRLPPRSRSNSVFGLFRSGIASPVC